MEKEFFDQLGQAVEPRLSDLIGELVATRPFLVAGLLVGLIVTVVGILIAAS